MAQDIPQLIADAKTLLATLPYQATERLTLLATVTQLEKTHAALLLAQPIIEADYHAAIEAPDSDWEGMAFTILEAVNAAIQGVA